MTSPTSPPRSTAKRVAVAGGLALVLLLVAAVASGSRGADDSDGLPVPHIRWLVSAVFVVLLLVGIVTFVAVLLQPRERRPPRSTLSQLRILLIAAALVLVLLLIVEQRRDTDEAEQDPTAQNGDDAPAAPAADLESETVWRDVALLVGLLVIGATVAVVADGRRLAAEAAAGGDERREAAALSDVLDEAVDALRAEPDPRRAVIAAYAHVERSLRFHRLPRRPSETAIEYLGRLLEHLDASGPAIRRLTGLFQRAMFSRGEVDRAMQDEAIDALVDVRDELRAMANAGPDPWEAEA